MSNSIPRTRKNCSKAVVFGLVTLLAACAAPPRPVAQPPVDAPITIPSTSPVPESPSKSGLERKAEFERWMEQQGRLYRASAPLLIKNTDLCRGNARNILGITAKTKYSYFPYFSEDFLGAQGLGVRLRVTDVLPGSGAEKAGLRRGDILQAANGKSFTQGPNAERSAAQLLSAAIHNRTSVNLVISRAGKIIQIPTPLTYACYFFLEVGNSEEVSSYSDGDRIMLTLGMLQYTQSEDEIAYVVAKEMAHNILERTSMLQPRRPELKSLIDSLRVPGSSDSDNVRYRIDPYSQLVDAAADELSLYLLTKAGYSATGALQFWMRFAEQFAGGGENAFLSLHPSTDYRIEAMKQTISDIEKKISAGQPLRPAL